MNRPDTEYFRDRLINCGINPSLHRLKIYEYLVNHPTHPSVDEIYLKLHPEIPTLSKTTVYNTLKLLIDKNLIQSITIEEKEVRYDADISFHGHFKCTHCGQIYDIPMDPKLEEKISAIDGHRIQESHIYLRGICKKCLKE